MPSPRMNRQYAYELDGYVFKAPSARRKHKKYDVYSKDNGQYIASFGDHRYQQYYDKIGHYSQQNHKNAQRRAAYYARHGHMKDYRSPKFFSHNYLW